MGPVNFDMKTESKLVLIFTFVIWSLFFLFRFLITLSAGGDWQPLLLFVTGMLGTLITWLIARKMTGLHLIIIFVFGLLVALFAETVSWEIGAKLVLGEFSWEADNFRLTGYVATVYWGSYIFFTWYLGYFAIVNYYRFVREALAAVEARAHANEAQLEMLRYQINPHFLFNTLNSISSLVLDNKNEKAEKMIEGLSRFLRFSLDRVPNVLTPLSDEIAVIKEYLEIEEIRFSDKLTIKYDIANDTLRCLVPSLIMQPAIENAIKHGIAPLKSDGIIEIRARIHGPILEFCIVDSGKGLSKQVTYGIGMKNTQERLKALYGSEGSITLRNDDRLGGTAACINIPVKKKTDNKLEAKHD